jgi:hypothetical protein
MTYDNILSLAPDTATLARARKAALAGRWRGLAGDGEALWGEYAGSGGNLYKTMAKLGDLSARCTCPSGKSPCKHALALLLIYADHPDTFSLANARPEWVSQWLRLADTKPDTGRRGGAQHGKTHDKRLELMQNGVDELETWLCDLIEQGLANLQNAPANFWDEFAARMVDSKLGAVARRIRLFKNLMAVANRHEKLLGELGELYLFVQAFRRIEEMPPPLRQELLTFGGVTVKKDEVLQNVGVGDRWLVTGRTEGAEEDLRYRRVWLLGEKSRRHALILDFAWKNEPFPDNWITGSVFNGEVVFYPAAFPQRALVRKMEFSSDPFSGFDGLLDLDSFARQYAHALASNPWLMTFYALLADVIPVVKDGRGALVDIHKKQIPLYNDLDACWKLVAISGGRSLQFFGEWDGESFRPHSAIVQGKLVEV